MLALVLAGPACSLNPVLDILGKSCDPAASSPCGGIGSCLASGAEFVCTFDAGLQGTGGTGSCAGSCRSAWAAPTTVENSLYKYGLQYQDAGGGGVGGGCRCDNDCACPQRCVADPYFSAQGIGFVCEAPCQQPSDCPDPATSCGPDGACQFNACGASTQNGAADGTCRVGDAGLGSCLAISVYEPNGTTPFEADVCLQGGTNDGGPCLLQTQRSNASELCPAGSVCIVPQGTSFGSCFQLCALDDAGCPLPSSCNRTGLFSYCAGK